jgi:hypothetical protein
MTGIGFRTLAEQNLRRSPRTPGSFWPGAGNGRLEEGSCVTSV